MLKIYLLRHGQTDYNVRNIVQGGGINSSLNDEGRKQAGKFFAKYGSVNFEKIFCTELKRTSETLSAFTMQRRTVIIPELNEISWGILEGREATPDVTKEFYRVTGLWNHGILSERVEGGESAEEAGERAMAGFSKILRESPEKGNVLVCTHGRMLRILLSGITGYGLRKMNIFPHENTGLNVLRVSAGKKISVEVINDLSHLSENLPGEN
jgi:probable phosphoglycerate mutase